MAIGNIGNDKKNNLIYINKNDNKYFDKDIYNEISIYNKNESRSIICANVKENSLVLDIGCAQGAIGKYLKENNNCKMYGIEIDKLAIQYANETKAYEKIYNFDITNSFSDEYKEFFKLDKQFDYIIFSDVLEHLVNPSEVIYSFLTKLKSTGKILISIPNIAHYDIIRGLLNEKFNYSKMGILDNTHLRFFTKSSFAEYICSMNSKYNINLDLKFIGKTEIKPNFYGQYSYIDKFIPNNLLVLQNIFEITKINEGQEPKNLNELLQIDNKDVMADINHELSSLNHSLEEKDDKIKKLNSVINSKPDIETLMIKNQEIAELKTIINNQQNEIKRLTSNEYIHRDTIDYLNNEYNKILNSKSWQLARKMSKFKIPKIKKEKTIVDNKQSILFIVHSWVNVYDKNMTNIGGTTLHVLELINSIKNQINCYVLTIINNKYALVLFENDKQYIYDLYMPIKSEWFDNYNFDFLTLLFDLIYFLKIDLVHIHHLSGFPCDLQFLPSKIKTIVTLHDYYSICPKLTLMNYKKGLCINGHRENCQECLLNQNIDFSTRDNAIRNLLKNSEVVIAPDESVFEEIKHYVDINNIKTIPHGIDISNFERLKRIKRTDSIKNIAIIGFINEHKGSKILRDLVDNNDNKNIVYHLFGESIDQYLNSNHPNYVFHGKYQKKDLPKLLVENKIDLVLLPAVLPETFSYTLSEALFAKIPCVSYNLGAIANRIKKDNIGWVIDKQSDFDYCDFTNLYDIIFEEKNYKKVLENLEKFKDRSIAEMVNETIELYNRASNLKTKNYSDIKKFMERYYLKYIL